MNRIKTFKYKTNNNENNSASLNGSSNVNHLNSPTAAITNNNGILTKISKRYSTFSAKIIKRQSPGRKNVSPQKVISGSYNMTGSHSDDHRLEIGAPVLISTTQIDVETLERKISEMQEKKLLQQQSQAASSGSETEIYADAVNTLSNVTDIKFKFLQDSPEALVPKETAKTPINKSSPQSDNTSESYYETPTIRRTSDERDSMNSRHSKSVNNLCKSEIKVYLQKAPSLSMELNSTTANLEHCHDLPIVESEYCTPRAIPKTVVPEDNSLSKSVPTSPYQNTLQMQSHYMSVDSLSIASSKVQKSLFKQSVNTLDTLDSSFEDFDLKSVSCQSLNNPNLMESLDEIDEITRQINQAEQFNNQDIDLEYCNHRDNLKPNERRVTLMKNKNSSKFLNQNKEKINHAWSGLKSWIGEEKSKFNKAMQKQAAMQRVGANDSSTPKRTKSSSNLKVSTMSLNNKSVVDGSVAPSDICDTTDATDAENIEESTSTCMSDHLNGGNVSPIPKKERTQLQRWEGQNGFDELRRYVKQGGDFGKELLSIMEARVQSEQNYSKSLSKMAVKLNKACRDLPGSIAEAWRSVATEMETRSESHRIFSSTLEQEIVKPMEEFIKTHHKTRKSVEDKVDKAASELGNWRLDEAKAKKMSHNASRENEKLQDAMLDVRIQKSPSVAQLHQSSTSTLSGSATKNKKDIKSAEKDYAKLENKRRKAEEAVKRADVEYYTNCLRAERARVDWELAVMRSSTILQTLENQRLTHMKNYVSSYLKLTGDMNPAQNSLVQRLTPLVENCNIQKDLNIIKNLRRISEGPSEQLLPDFYCEHTTLAMNRERRKQALIKLLQLVKTDLERERRSRNGLKEVAATMNQTEIQVNTNTDKLYHIRSILTYLEGARFKLHSALLELDHKPRTSHPLSSHIQITRDRTGMQQSILKVPLWLKNNDKVHNTSDNLDDSYEAETQPIKESEPVETSCKNEVLIHKLGQRSNSNLETSMLKTVAINYENTNFDRGVADGGSNQPDSDFDEFSSQEDVDSSRKYQIDEKLRSLSISENEDVNVDDGVDTSSGDNKIILSKCKALYSYKPMSWDELELSPGDVIEVFRKQKDGWWEGDLVGKAKSGIFPATYVEEFF